MTQKTKIEAALLMGPIERYSEIMGIDLKKKNRKRQYVWGRFAVWYHLIHDLGARPSDVAKMFDMHHSTVIYGVRQMKQQLEQNDETATKNIARIHAAAHKKTVQIKRGALTCTIQILRPEIGPEKIEAIASGAQFEFVLKERQPEEGQPKELIILESKIKI